jgi:cardiolipin synthase A/B
VKLIIQPDAGITPLLRAVNQARKSIDIVIFRLNLPELEKAIAGAVARGVTVRALIAHTNHGGERNLRKLEMRLLEEGVTVARTADDLTRYHGKMMIVDETLYVLGFNFTRLDIERSRSFGVITSDKRLVKEANALFIADSTRQPYSPGHDRFVVSPESSRELLTDFIKGARKELLIYNVKVSDRLVLRALQERLKEGVGIRVIGKVDKRLSGAETRKLATLRLHVRAIVRDGSSPTHAWRNRFRAPSSRIGSRAAARRQVRTKRLLRLRLRPPLDDARIDDVPGSRDCVEEQLIGVDFGGQERLIGIETDCGETGLAVDAVPA